MLNLTQLFPDMKINLTTDFRIQLIDIVKFIAFDKVFAVKKCKKELLLNIKKVLQNTYNFKKSIFFNSDLYRNYVFKDYSLTCKIDVYKDILLIVDIIKYKNLL